MKIKFIRKGGRIIPIKGDLISKHYQNTKASNHYMAKGFEKIIQSKQVSGAKVHESANLIQRLRFVDEMRDLNKIKRLFKQAKDFIR